MLLNSALALAVLSTAVESRNVLAKLALPSEVVVSELTSVL